MEAMSTTARGQGALQEAVGLPGSGVAATLRAVASARPAGDRAGIDQLRELEDLKSTAAAAQARIAVAYDLAVRREPAAAGVPADDRLPSRSG